jgi:hypothetical protein
MVMVFVLGLGGGAAFAQKSTMNLESLVRQSGMIFAGRVIGVETGIKDQMNLYMTRYTFEVFDPIFGVEEDTISIKQYGGEADGKKLYPAGVPRFERGEEVLVMLYPPSKIGMTSTVGKDQGKFWIQSDDSSGNKTVVNKLQNAGLFKKLKYPGLAANPDWAGSGPGPLPYDGFVETVRNLTAELRKNNEKR